MPALDAERIGETLWILGNVDRSMEKDLSTVLEKYVKDIPAEKQLVDMTNVSYFASSAAKVLIGFAQETEAKGSKLKVRSSMPVMQTLNLLGAKTWLDIEASKEPNAKPASPPATKTSATGIVPASRTAAPAPAKPAVEKNISADATSLNVHIKPVEQRSPTVVLTPTKPGASGKFPSVGASAVTDEAAMAAQTRAGAPLLKEGAEVEPDLAALRQIVVLGTYTFRFNSGMEITGKVLDHVGGPWVLIDTRGSRRLINITQAGVIDIL